MKPDKDTFSPICTDCGWKGNHTDLLNEDEVNYTKNVRRTELIDSMLT
jgi:hypothetical protein